MSQKENNRLKKNPGKHLDDIYGGTFYNSPLEYNYNYL